MYFQPLAQSPGLDWRAISIVRPTGEAAKALAEDHRRAMLRQWADAPLSRRGTPEYARIRRDRRCDLEAILRTGVSSENRERAMDIICAICEESSWSEKSGYPFEDPMHPEIDLFAAETACLMGWAVRCGGFDVRTCARMTHEIRARFTTPIMAHDDYPCLSGKGFGYLAIICDAMAASLLAETDSARLFTFLRRISRMTDRLTEGYGAGPLDSQLMDWTAATALWNMLRAMAGPQAGGRAVPLPGWLDSLLISNMGGGLMADPMGEGVRMMPNGADIYYLGRLSGDRELCALGASLYRRENAPLSSINARMTFDVSEGILSGIDSVRWLRHSAVSGGSVMTAHSGNSHAIMYGCARENAGGMFVSIGGMAALVPVSGNAPRINGLGQTSPKAEGDWEFAGDRDDMYCDMTKCYPEAAGLDFYQRTLMLDRVSGSVRVVDLIEARRPGTIEYFMAVPGTPDISETGARTPTCRILWDPARPSSAIREDVPGYSRLDVVRLEYQLEPGRNIINFYFEET